MKLLLVPLPHSPPYPPQRYWHLATTWEELEGILSSEARAEQCGARSYGIPGVSGDPQGRATSWGLSLPGTLLSGTGQLQGQCPRVRGEIPQGPRPLFPSELRVVLS